MLTADLVRPRLRVRGNQLSVEMIDSSIHWLKTAAELLHLLNRQIGQTQGAWEAALEGYIGERMDYTVIRGMAKVIEDQAIFEPTTRIIAPEALRAELFARGPVFEQPDLFHPQSRSDLLDQFAQQLNSTAKLLERMLYADRAAEQILRGLNQPWTPSDVIARYNLELARGVLYWATEMHIDIYDHFKDFWRYIKLFKLMFWATPNPDGGYHVTLDGPISPFVRATTRYGRQFAAFLPALFLGEHWQMRADVQSPLTFGERQLQYTLDHTTPLTTHFKDSGLYDSLLEADFAAEFAEKFGDERGQWLLTREDEVLLLGDTVMIPDFAVTHKRDGRRALIEIVGFWHPNYLWRKVEKVRAANRSDLVLLVYEGVNLTEEKLHGVPGEVLYFKNKPVLKDVMAVIERAAQPAS